ncbi:metal homeostasis factor Atx2p [[Candida] jaroonii]|uniref:Metal homeostasis factor Atx2p n=1 Tax=[Candida] jaroonii TaxID=467808 RepID=A0ACA9YB91_9ASCO|nr:metal homeostasis factor Atx2p [[Candida] jaroonii]
MTLLSYGVGMVPILLESSHQTSSIIQISNGLLFGTLLFLAIPETLELFIDTHKSLKWISFMIVFGFLCMHQLELYNHRTEETVNLDQSIPSPDHELTNYEVFKSIFHNTLILTLILHSIVDGIAIGSSFHNKDISFLFSLVIIIHKLPTCFSLSGLLLEGKTDLRLIRLYIGIFSITTPISSILTFLVLYLIKINDFIISLCLLFSLGNFLYLLMVIKKPGDTNERLVFMVGFMVPLLLSFLNE